MDWIAFIASPAHELAKSVFTSVWILSMQHLQFVLSLMSWTLSLKINYVSPNLTDQKICAHSIYLIGIPQENFHAPGMEFGGIQFLSCLPAAKTLTLAINNIYIEVEVEVSTPKSEAKLMHHALKPPFSLHFWSGYLHQLKKNISYKL